MAAPVFKWSGLNQRDCCCCAIFEGDPDPTFPLLAYHAPANMQMVLSGNAHNAMWNQPAGVIPATTTPHCCNDFNDIAALYSDNYNYAFDVPAMLYYPSVLYCPPIDVDDIDCLLQWYGFGGCLSNFTGTPLGGGYNRRFSTYFFSDKATGDKWIGVGLHIIQPFTIIASAFGYLNLGPAQVDPAGGPWVVPITSPAACTTYPYVMCVGDGRTLGSAPPVTSVQSCWDVTPGVVTVTPIP